MKMPRRSYFPPLSPYLDIFGLPHMSMIEAAGESEQEKRRRVAKVENGVTEAFKAAVHHLGHEQARQLFAKVARRSKRGRGKALAPDRDHRLLAAYDDAVWNGEAVASLARRLRASGIELGNTAAAIAAQIRKLAKERNKRKRAAAVQSRFIRMATRNEPPSLLEAARSKK